MLENCLFKFENLLLKVEYLLLKLENVLFKHENCSCKYEYPLFKYENVLFNAAQGGLKFRAEVDQIDEQPRRDAKKIYNLGFTSSRNSRRNPKKGQARKKKRKKGSGIGIQKSRNPGIQGIH
jgi:hypothetical protein